MSSYSQIGISVDIRTETWPDGTVMPVAIVVGKKNANGVSDMPKANAEQRMAVIGELKRIGYDIITEL